jgi:uncharacterized coiled-coil protein SlyX
MKTTAFLCLLLLLSAGCNNRVEELEKQNASLQSTNQRLSQDLVSRDEYVDNVTNEINGVYASIEEMKAKEGSVLRETSTMESDKKLSREEMRGRLIDRVRLIHESLEANHKRLASIQSRLSASKKQYAGLQKMLDNLKQTLAERDQSIAALTTRVTGLEQEVTDKTQMITQKDAVISDQHRVITTTFYIAGTRDELEKKGIIKDEGGFLWGLLGSTATLASGFDPSYFKPLDKEMTNTIAVNGKIDEIIPKRSESFYKKTELGNDQTMLTIASPDRFWQDKYLVIVTDRPSTN